MECLPSTPFVKVSVRLAKGNRLPNLSPGTDRIYGSTCHQYAVSIFGDTEVFFQILGHEESHFLFFLKAFFVVDARFELTTNDPRPAVDAT